MRERLYVVVAAFISLAILAFSGAASARLIAFGPHAMVHQVADAIVIAEVVSKQRQDGERPRIVYELQVQTVLKGQVSEDQLTIVVGPVRPLAPPPDMLPDPGTRVFVLLSGAEDKWSLAADLNAVGIIEGDRVVSLHRGARVGMNDQTWTPEDYVAVYQTYYEQRTQMYEDDRTDESPSPEDPTAPTDNGTAPVGWWEKLLHWLRNLLR